MIFKKETFPVGLFFSIVNEYTVSSENTSVEMDRSIGKENVCVCVRDYMILLIDLKKRHILFFQLSMWAHNHFYLTIKDLSI